MNDPWDVKCVRQSSQYLSCMKLNGVPLLPPVLSKECRKEMQYYKLLALEVEKRIQTLKTVVFESDTESTEDKTDAPDLPESEQNDISFEAMGVHNSKIEERKDVDNLTSSSQSPVTEIDSRSKTPSQFVIDLSLSLNNQHTPLEPDALEVPERDWECTKPKAVTPEEENKYNSRDKLVFSVSVNNENITDPLTISFNHDDPPSLSAKSFTGSLNNIHTDSKVTQSIPLSRQRSYTVLNPSPLLLAHLEIQSLNTGVDIHSISMSESMSNLTSPNKKRRSWDLESAKVKWSSMALELKQKNIDRTANKNVAKSKKVSQPAVTHTRTRSLVQERGRRLSNIYKPVIKSEPIQRPKKNPSPVRNATSHTNKSPVTKSIPNGLDKKVTPSKQLTSESEDPATRVRELYEKIQKQQLIQMAALVEKQKKEQMLLQQVFEEQNNLLFTQLKTICPKPPNDIKEAWSDKADRGPVSLSQLINSNSPDVMTDTNNYLNQCDNVLKKSRDITGSIKKGKSTNEKHLPKLNNGSRNTSPVRKNETSRKLTYETTSSDRDYELILTDRTNDTMADLNVTFATDNDECQLYQTQNIHKELKSASMALSVPCRSTDRAIKSMEETIHNSIKSMCVKRPSSMCRSATPEERAAASKIVAYAKGYLVRRLLRTERVQGTVQTIKDALLCALQLHQDREGIRGADVDLHRRLIQQITAACYSLHDTFITSSPAERCAMIGVDRDRRRLLANRPPPVRQHRPTDL
ncbi:unnamed protein product [Leptosia nina]